MKELSSYQDIHSISEVSADINSYIKHVFETKKPLILTLNDQNKAVLLDFGAYEALIEQLDLLKDIHTALDQVRNEKFLSNDEAKLRLLNEE